MMTSNKLAFSEIMREWLYNPNTGYYTQNHVGKAGDFYTSVSVSKFFGGAISRYILRMLDEKRLTLPLHIVEIGSNNGDLIADIAEFLKAFSDVVFIQSSFCVIEPLVCLHTQQMATFQARITARFAKQLHIYNNLQMLKDTQPNNVFFISNELFDSMPCDIFHNNNMLYFHNNNFTWDKPSSEISEFMEKYDIKSAEIPLIWESFIQNLCNLPCKWIFLTFDYGDFLAREMNIRMYMQHKVYNLYEELQNDRLAQFIGKSDITYDIDFSLLKKILENNNAKVLCNVTQSKFLIESCEILDIFESFSTHFSTIQLSKQRASLQGLIAPNAMGERFRALVCGV